MFVTIHGLEAAHSNESGRYSEFCCAKVIFMGEGKVAIRIAAEMGRPQQKHALALSGT